MDHPRFDSTMTVEKAAAVIAELYASSTSKQAALDPDIRNALIGGGIGAGLGGLGGVAMNAASGQTRKKPLTNFLLGAGIGGTLGAGAGFGIGRLGSPKVPPRSERIQKLIEIVKNPLTTPEQLEELAKAEGTSVDKLKQAVGADSPKTLEQPLTEAAADVVNRIPSGASFWGSSVFGQEVPSLGGVGGGAALPTGVAAAGLAARPWAAGRARVLAAAEAVKRGLPGQQGMATVLGEQDAATTPATRSLGTLRLMQRISPRAAIGTAALSHGVNRLYDAGTAVSEEAKKQRDAHAATVKATTPVGIK